MKNTEGYSGTPLEKKLGFREGMTVLITGQPDHYFSLFHHPPVGVLFTSELTPGTEFIHFFTDSLDELSGKLPLLKDHMDDAGCIWVSWPKRSSGRMTDLTEDVIRDLALKNGLVDIKVCAVDQTWSALKLVIPRRDRKKP